MIAWIIAWVFASSWIVQLAYSVKLYRRHESDCSELLEKHQEAAAARAQIADLLRENELANKECEQNRIVIDAAKDERLKMLTELAELRKARMEAAEALADQSTKAKEQWEKMQSSLNAHADKIWMLAKDIDERSEVIRKLSTLAENYRQQIAELKTARPARGGNGRFARRQVAG